MKKGRFLLAPLGTEGDVRPMAALGMALMRAGHDVTLAASKESEHLARAARISFARIDFSPQEFFLSNPDMATGNPIRTIRPMLNSFSSIMKLQLGSLLKLGRGTDVLVCSGLLFAGFSVAEKLGLRYRHVTHIPAILPSSYHAPISSPLQNLPRWGNRLVWFISTHLLSVALRARYNNCLRENGLSPDPDMRSLMTRNPLIAMDSTLAPVPPDVKVKFDSTAYWPLRDRDQTIPAEVERFIAAGDTPLYIGFGSMAQPNPKATLEIIRRAVEEAGVRAIVTGGWAGFDVSHSGPSLHVVERLPHGAILPHLRAALHHGGAGTTWTVAKAGIPQAVIPHLLDQFYWNERIRRLHIGPAGVPRQRITPRKMAAILDDLATNSDYRAPAEELSREIATRDGIAEAVRLFEDLLG